MLGVLFSGDIAHIIMWLTGVIAYAFAAREQTQSTARPLILLSLWFVVGTLPTLLGLAAALLITAVMQRYWRVMLPEAVQGAFVLLPVVGAARFFQPPTLLQMVLLVALGGAGYWLSRAVLRRAPLRPPVIAPAMASANVLLLLQVVPMAHLGNPWLAALLLAGLVMLAVRTAPDDVPAVVSPADIRTTIDYIFEAVERLLKPTAITLVQHLDEQHYRVIQQRDDTRTDKETHTLSPLLRQAMQYDTLQTTSEHAGVVVPLRCDGQHMGVLLVERTHRAAVTREQMARLQQLADQAAASLMSAHDLHERQRQIDALTHLNRLSADADGMTRKNATAVRVIESALAMFNAHQAVLYHLDEENQRLRLSVSPWQDASNSQQHTLVPVKPDIDLVLSLVQEEQVRVVKQHQRGQTRTLLLAPLLRRPHVVEILVLAFEGARTFKPWQLDALTLLAKQAASHLEVAALNENIRAGNNRMRTILSSIQDGVVLLDRQQVLLDYNAAAERLLALPLADYVGTTFANLPHDYHPVDTEHHEAPFGMRRQAAQPAHYELAREEGNDTIYMEQIWLPVHDAHDRMSGHVVVLRDITDQKQLAAARNEMIFMLVHDLRSPLGSVIAGLRFAKDLTTEPDGITYLPDVLQVAYNSSRRLLRLINTLLDVEREQMEIIRDIYHISQIAEQAYLELRQAAKEAKISITQDIPDDLPFVYVDYDKIQRVLINLLDNAIDYSKEQVMVTAHATASHVVVRVSDDGSGIPPDRRDAIFEKFSLADNQHKRRGKHSGIGLAFCRRAIEAHDCTIDVVDGCALPGACFEFTLPIYEEDRANT